MTKKVRASLERIAALLVCLVATALLLGCSEHLVGTNDEELDYKIVAPESGKATSADLVVQGVRARLSAAQLFADVDPVDDATVRVTVDRDLAATVDSLVRWRGGVQVYRVDPSFAFVPEDTFGLEEKGETGKDGSRSRYFTGTIDALRGAMQKTKLEKGHLVFFELVAGDTYRTRVVADPAVCDLSAGIKGMTREKAGRALHLTFTPAAVDCLKTAADAHSGADAAVVRDRSLLAVEPLADLASGQTTVDFGADIVSFTRAHATMELLASPVLPTLERAHASALPPNRALAVACVVVPMLLSLGWLVFVRQFDRARPEPWWLVLATFALGGVSVVPACLAEYAYIRSTPYLDPTVMTLGGQLAAFPVALVVYTLVIGFSEEGSKFLGAWTLARHRREFDEPVDGIVYGCASALGFAALENVKYFAVLRMSGSAIALRTFTSVPAHMFFGALWGYALGNKLVRKKTSVFLFLLLAAACHGAFDAMLSTDGLGALATLLDLGLGVLFIVLLRRALRHGALDPARAGRKEPPASSARAYYPVGRGGYFAAYAGTMLVSAALLMAVGTAFEILHRRVSYPFLAIASTLLMLFGLAAFGLSQTMPLDVAVDEQGVTFAGGASPWETIVGFDRYFVRGLLSGYRGWVRLRTKDGGVVRLGPGAPDVIERLAAVVGARLTARRAA